jgi:FkbH-like protein
MILQLEDFAALRVNWNNKAENILAIATELQLSPDAMVFVDDSPFERELVRRLVPQVSVPEMPEDSADFAAALDRGRYFESVSLSSEDVQRHEMYAANRTRAAAQAGAVDLDSYLQSLGMQYRSTDLSAADVPRIAQLINKTNQFNMTGARTTEAQIAASIQDAHRGGRAYRMSDRFGDNGLISAVLFEVSGDTMLLQNWVMSCRVLQRGVEIQVHGDLLATARKMNLRRIVGQHVKTERNAITNGHFANLGYRLLDHGGATTQWAFDVGPE